MARGRVRRQRRCGSARALRHGACVCLCVLVWCGGGRIRKRAGLPLARARRPLLTVLTSLTMDADTGLRPLKFHQPVSVSIT